MARPPLLVLSGAAVTHGGRPLFAGVDLAIHPGDRIALVGRNGSGKSTLLRLLAGEAEADAGRRSAPPGLRIARMAQEPDFAGHASLGDFVAAGLPAGEDHRAAAAMQALGLDPARAPAAASGGERRRAALARALAAAPDLLLLDEPTNHLDIRAILALEAHLAATRAAFVLVSHDRAFLSRLTRITLWLDRGILRRRESGFAGFEDWRDRSFAEEDAARHRLDRLIAAEGRWAVEGISARRRRNQGRLRRLAALRAERRDQIRREGPARIELAAAPPQGRLAIEARGVSVARGGRVLLRDLSLRVLRGDRLAIVGPNGAGKTTLLRLLAGSLAPDSGEVRLGTGLVPAVLDQDRAALDPARSLAETLTGDPAIGAGSDQVMVRGTPRHVLGYLRDFLFPESRARSPVASLSGGEKARLLLARILARPANLLVLDEPTNDLDIETLDLLEERLDEYEGTVLLVSHDRDFIDRVATATLLLEGDGRATLHAGGWSDLVAQRGAEPFAPAVPGPGADRAGAARGAQAAAGRRDAPAAAPPPSAPGPGRGAPAASRPGARREAQGDGAPDPAARAGADPAGGTGGDARAPAPAPAAARKAKLSFREAHRLAALPGEIDRISAEIARLEALLADPAPLAGDPERLARAGTALAERLARRDALEEEWLALEARREALGG